MSTFLHNYLTTLSKDIPILKTSKGDIKMKLKELILNNKRKVIVAASLLTVAAVVTIGITPAFSADGARSTTAGSGVTADGAAYKEEVVAVGDIVVGTSEISTASMATYDVTLPFATEVIEYYVKQGEYVNEGDALFAINTQNYSELYAEISDSLEAARISLTAAQLKAESDKLAAAAEYDMNVINGTQAQNIYDLTIEELNQNLAKLEAEVLALEQQKADLEAQIAAAAESEDDSTSSEETDSETETVDTSETGDPVAPIDEDTPTTDNTDSNTKTLEDQLSDVITSLSSKYNERDSYKVTIEQKTEEASSTYDSNISDYNNAYTDYENTIATINNTVSTAQTKVVELENDLAELVSANLSGGVYYASISGYVMSYTEADRDINAGSTILSIADSANITVAVSIAQEDITEISIGDDVNVVFDAYEDTTVRAVVDSIVMSPSSGMSSSVNYTVNILCDLSSYTDMIVFQGMSATLTFVEKQVNDVLIISNKCITVIDGKQYVKMLDASGELYNVEVTTGFSDGFDTEITSGLTQGDVVIIESVVS